MKDNRAMIKKLQTAINQRFGEQLLYERRQFYSEKENRPVNVYTIKKATYDRTQKCSGSKTLFKSTSQLQVILYLRDYWYECNGWDIPWDNAMWNDVKRRLGLVDSVKEGIS